MTIPNIVNPLELFATWYAEAEACETIDDHTAVTLATVDEAGVPDARVVLLKGYDERGFVFYTNLGSVKTQQLTVNPHAAMCFYWMPLEKQVRVRGSIIPVTDDEADAYHATRPRESQIGAWASKQSQPLEGRFQLEKRIARFAAKFNVRKVPRPEFWSGFRIQPSAIEFWFKQPYRLHDRVRYTPPPESGGEWDRQRLYP
jgi:pyridoxamine 5'-phosphate oxidase